MEVVLSSANSWTGPTGDFALGLKMARPEEIAATCFPATLHEGDPATLESPLVNFAPAANLRVIFIRDKHFDFDFSPEKPEIR